MTPGITTIPAAELRLEELLKAGLEASTEVWPGRTAEDHQMSENVYLGEVRGDRAFHSMPALTSRSRQENYEITVIVELAWEGTDITGARKRLWELGLAAEAVIALNPTLGDLAGIKEAIAGRFARPPLQCNEEEVLGQYQFGVRIDARL